MNKWGLEGIRERSRRKGKDVCYRGGRQCEQEGGEENRSSVMIKREKRNIIYIIFYFFLGGGGKRESDVMVTGMMTKG